MKAFSRCFAVGRIGIEPENDAGGHFQSVGVERADPLEDRQRRVLFLAHLLERIDLGSFDADEDGLEFRLAHQRKNFRFAWRY